MINRIRQFISAVRVHITDQEYRLVQKVLTPKEQVLFNLMDKIDQKHCINVARTCQQLISGQTGTIDYNLLIKAALLHDVGKQKGTLKLSDRVLIVLLQSFFPAHYHKLAATANSPWYIAQNHPAIGAELCRRAGCSEELTKLVALHQQGGLGKELEILVIADKQN